MSHTSIIISWPAGSGINTIGIILGGFLSSQGYHVLGDKEYASVIKGENNIFVLYISDEGPFLTRHIDAFFSLDRYGIEKNAKIYNLAQVFDLSGKDNIHLLGFAAKWLGISLSEIEAFMETNYPKLFGQIEKLRAGYTECEHTGFVCKHVGEKKIFPFGNELVAKGGMASGLDFFSAYPMTPASSLIDVITENPKVTFFQWEDEIAVAISMLGAKYAGARAVCGTSGGGFALMSESLAFSNQAEIGGVYILSQRTGPSTGTPTFTEQSDMLYAINASFGDTKPIVLTPSTFEEGYNFMGKALNWSDMYQHPLILLLDKQFSESYLSIDPAKLIAEPINRGKLEENPDEKFARYTITEDGVSPYTIPGTKDGEHMATSYDHDIYGATSENPEEKKLSTEKRFRKVDTFVKNEFNDTFSGFEIINPGARKFFICTGFARYAVEWAIRDRNEWGCIIIKSLQPIDIRLKSFLDENFDHIERLTFVDNNYSGQLEEIVSNALLDDRWKSKTDRIRKYTLYPIFEEELCETI